MAYFDYFPTIRYNGRIARNVLSRVTIDSVAQSDRRAYYEYSLPAGERPDTLSYDYYDTPYYDWLISLTNKVLDPYYSYTLSDNDLASLVVKKYGSIPAAYNTILYFMSNWQSDESYLSPSAYDALAVGPGGNQKKYWDPVVDSTNTPVAYIRKKEDLYSSTNMVISLSLTPQSGQFIEGERLLVNGIGAATLVYYPSSGQAIVNHVTGNLSGAVITGFQSGATAQVTSSTVVDYSIPVDEQVYYYPVNAYDHEYAVNQGKSNVLILENTYAGQAQAELKNILKV